jgi:hypothetical protein
VPGRRLSDPPRRHLLALVSMALGLALALVPVAEALASADAEPQVSGARAEKVLIVSLPRVRWADVAEHRPPVLTRLLADSAVASLSVRTIGSITRPGDAYATIGAGNRARAPEDLARLAFSSGARYRAEAVTEVFERRCGCAAGDAAVLHLGAGPVAESNRRLRYGAEPGALGTALAEAGRTAAVVANADPGLEGDEAQREAALAVADGDGRVPAGTVGPELLTADPSAPFGRRTDAGATIDAFAGAWDAADVVLLELGDLERADRHASLATPAASARARADALARADAVLGDVLAGVDLARHLVVVVAPTEPRALPVELTVAALAGPGFEPGLASSGTTRRDGYVTLPDLAPTVLGALGVEVPTAMNGAPIAAAGGPRPGPALFEQLAGDNERAVFRNRVTGPVTVGFIVLQVLAYGMAVVALRAGGLRLRRFSTLLALTVVAAPSVAFLSGLVPYAALGLVGYPVAFFAAAAVLAGAAWAACRRRASGADQGSTAAPLLLAGLLLAILVVDVAVGGPLQIDTVFGYSPIVAGRFAGYGNLAFGLLAMSAIVVGTGAWGWGRPRRGDVDTEEPERRRPGDRRRTAAVASLFAVTILAIGLPWFGTDVGGVLSAVPAFLVTLAVLRGSALGWRRLAAMAGATLGMMAAFGAVDLLRPPASRTHLGRFLARIGEPGAGGAVTVIERKIASNLSILTSSLWTVVIPVAIAFLAFLAWRQPGLLRRLEAVAPGTRACLIGGLVVAVLGGLLNDSGVAIPGIMFAVLLPYLTVLALVGGTPAPAGEGP